MFMPSLFARSRTFAGLALLPFAISCASTTEPKSDAPVASIDITLTPEPVVLGQTAVATAIAKDSSGRVIKGAPIVWEAGYGVTITPAGVVTGTVVGHSGIRASTGSATSNVYNEKIFRIVRLPAVALTAFRQRLPLVRSGAPNTFDGEPFVASLVDSSGAVVPKAGVVVTASTAGATLSGTRTATTDEQGYAVFTNLVITGASGAKTLTLSAAGYRSATLPFTLTSGVPAAITVVNGANQNGVSGWGTDAITVRITDAEGNVVPRATATFAVATGNGRIIVGNEPTSSVQTTDWDGLAAIPSWRLGNFGINTLSVTVAGIAPVIVTATAGHRITSAIIHLTTSPISPGQSVQATVSAIDENGVEYTPPDAVQWYIVGGAASITQTGMLTGISAGTGMVYIRIQGATAQAPYTVAGVATRKLVIANLISGMHVNGKLSPAPELQVVDAVTAAPVREAGIAVRVVYSPNVSVPSTLAGTLTVLTDAAGIARFTDLSVVGPVKAPFFLDFLSDGSVPVTSAQLSKSQ